MSYRDAEIMGGVDFGNDPFSANYDPYIPILNEPMGREFTPLNFEETDIKPNEPKLESKKKNYEYIPLSYKTDATSYMDSWRTPVKETMTNFELPYKLDFTTVLLFIFLLVITYLIYQNNQQNKKILKLLKNEQTV